MSFFLVLLVGFVSSAITLAWVAIAGYSLHPDSAKIASAKVWREQRRALNDSVEAWRVKS